MRNIHSKDTKVEKYISKGLTEYGLKFLKNDPLVFGRPDFTFSKQKVAVFCDGEFWHGKNWSVSNLKIKSNRAYWIKKIEGNIRRDIEVNMKLRREGWKVIRLWAKEIERDSKKCIDKIVRELNSIN